MPYNTHCVCMSSENFIDKAMAIVFLCSGGLKQDHRQNGVVVVAFMAFREFEFAPPSSFRIY